MTVRLGPKSTIALFRVMVCFGRLSIVRNMVSNVEPSASLTMIRALLLIVVCLTLSSCGTLKELQEGELAKTVGSFQINPVQPNTYWYNGKSYEYNEYEIEIISEPCNAIIQWDGKTIGTTPFKYYYSGILDKDDRVTIRAIPADENFPPQNAVLKIRTELPRKINFDLNKK
jgi:hypothetical protein